MDTEVKTQIGKPRRGNAGFTLIEALVTITIMGVFLSIGLPSYGSFNQKNRLRAAAEAISVDLHFARSEAISRGPGTAVNMTFITDGAAAWCYGLTTAASCDCQITDTADASACVIPMSGTNLLRTVSSTDYSGDVSLTSVTFAANTTGFSATRGLAVPGQAVLSANGNTVNVTLSALGRVRVCSASPLGYPTC